MLVFTSMTKQQFIYATDTKQEAYPWIRHHYATYTDNQVTTLVTK